MELELEKISSNKILIYQQNIRDIIRALPQLKINTGLSNLSDQEIIDRHPTTGFSMAHNQIKVLQEEIQIAESDLQKYRESNPAYTERDMEIVKDEKSFPGLFNDNRVFVYGGIGVIVLILIIVAFRSRG